ncbi:MAG: TetR/AcrR family transcriptional regulator [Gammaproteobacteria bacterium]|nr:TetR/AcrR family transcriptional regulator [Gammaproteobacteria bacterium]
MTTKKATSKRELTRARVIQAAIACIERDGFHAAHTNRIAEEAGVSWGVLQYHFGDKDGLLQAVMDQIFDDFSQTLSSISLDSSSLRQRVDQLIKSVWQLTSKQEYRVSVAILRNAGKDRSSSIDGKKQLADWARKTALLWERLFEEGGNHPANSDVAKRLLFATLRGMADEINPSRNKTKKAIAEECSALGQAVTYLLEQN